MRKIIFTGIFLTVISILSMQTMELSVRAMEPSPTPTYDPLVEPPLPNSPTEFELGRNLYWHWCMTCHGDRGQGLTDEWRAVWEKDHQNCWSRGCHAGRVGDMAFPIPTKVPMIIGDGQLKQFADLQDFAAFLQRTHPPQSPGILKEKEYHAIAMYVFTLNDRQLVDVTSTPVIAPVVESPATPASVEMTRFSPITNVIGTWTGWALVIVVGVLWLFGWWLLKRKK